MKNSNLTLRTNCELVNQHAKQMTSIIFKQIEEQKDDVPFAHMIYFNKTELNFLLGKELSYITVMDATVTDHGWLTINEKYDLGIKLEGILQRKKNGTASGDMGTCVKCPTARKNQRVWEITIGLDTEDEQILVISKSGELILCEYAEMFCYNWNRNSPEAQESLRKQQNEARESGFYEC